MATNHWDDSDASSSIYSQDQEMPIQHSRVKPLITRQYSSKSVRSTTSSKSGSSTFYSEEDIKSMGYRPFEYWKPPKTSSANKYPGPTTKTSTDPSTRRRADHLPTMPPPPHLTGHRNPTVSANAPQELKPLPQVKLLEVRKYINDVAASNNNNVAVAMPSSPRVKDRYAARYAAKQQRAARSRGGGEWPGWVPNEKEFSRTSTTPLLQQQTQRPAARGERWTSPSSWRRRSWGVMVSVGVLLLIAVIIVTTTLTKDNAASVNLRRGLEVDEDLAVLSPAASSSLMYAADAVKPRLLVAQHFQG